MAAATPSDASALVSWHASPSSHLLLDLRSASAFRRARLTACTSIPWTALEANLFCLPPQHSVRFAVLLPTTDEGREEERQWRTRPTSEAATTASKEPTTPADTAVAAAAASAPPGPSSPRFEFSHDALLSLLRFHGWVIPPEWVFVASDALWAAATELGILRGADDPVERRVLFSPSPCLERHFPYIQAQLNLARQASAPPTKQPRSDTAMCVASAVLPDAPSTPAAAPFECLDVACGSGRDMCWLLTTSSGAASDGASSSCSDASAAPSWACTGVDVSPHLVERAHHLARQLEVDSALSTYAARINQGNGAWRSTAEKAPPFAPDVTPDSSSSSSAASPAVASSPPISTAAPLAVPTVALKGSDQRREKRKLKEALRAAVTSSAGPAPSVTMPFLSKQYDLIIIVRFLSRVFIRSQLSGLLKPGGFFLLSTFIEDGVTPFDHPGPEFRIAGMAEVERFARDAGLEIVSNAIGRCEDGRPLSDTLLRKPLAMSAAP